jgi:hypothetical protein
MPEDVGRCVMCGADGVSLWTYPNGGTVADRNLRRCLSCWGVFHAEEVAAEVAEIWSARCGVEVEVSLADDPDWDDDRLETEVGSIPMVAVAGHAFAWVDASAEGWAVTLRDRLADDMEEVEMGEVAQRLRMVAW